MLFYLRKNSKIYFFLLTFFVFLLISIAFQYYYFENQKKSKGHVEFKTINNNDNCFNLSEIKFLLKTHGYWKIQQNIIDKLTCNNLQDTLKAIDPYSRYIPSQYASKPPIRSLGLEIFKYKERVYISPDIDGPAYVAGVKDVSELYSVNENLVITRDFLSILSLLEEAAKNDKVNLSIKNSFDGTIKSFIVTPEFFNKKTFSWKIFNDFFYIKIHEFVSHRTAPGIYALYKSLINKDSKVIIDLRGCSGGDLFEAFEIASMFISDSKLMMKTINKDGLLTSYSSPIGTKWHPPKNLLIDYRTASAAEFFVGILDYYNLSTVVGQNSFGKFFSQTPFILKDKSLLLLTTHEIIFPFNKLNLKKGITPDLYFNDISISTINTIKEKIFNK